MSGTLRERPTGSGRWELRVYVGRDPITGRPRQVSRVFRGGIREARRRLDELVHEVSEGRHGGTTVTVGRLLDEWLASIKRLKKAQSTREAYTIHVEKHIRPALGTKRLDRLTPHDLDRYFATLEDKGLAASTIKLDHAVLSAALSQAVDWGWIKANPAKRARLAEVERKETPAMTVEQLRRLYQAVLEDDEDMAVLIALGALTGCRRGELCGMRWSDVDWDRACIRVQRAWIPGKGGQYLTTTKSKKARTVFIGADGVAILRNYYKDKIGLFGREPSPDGWLISYDGGTTEMRAKAVGEYVSRLGRKLGIPVHLHTLRHFAATELVAAGVDLPTAAGQLGHTPQVMAEVYLHTGDERGAAAGELIAGVVREAILVPSEEIQVPSPMEPE